MIVTLRYQVWISNLLCVAKAILAFRYHDKLICYYSRFDIVNWSVIGCKKHPRANLSGTSAFGGARNLKIQSDFVTDFTFRVRISKTRLLGAKRPRRAKHASNGECLIIMLCIMHKQLNTLYSRVAQNLIFLKGMITTPWNFLGKKRKIYKESFLGSWSTMLSLEEKVLDRFRSPYFPEVLGK